MFIQSTKTEKSIQLDIIMVLIFLVFMSYFYYGLRALAVVGVSLAASYITDMICVRLRGEKYDFKNDFSAIISGIVLALMMPASVPYHVMVISNIVAVAIGKQIFGYHGKNIFNAVSVGFVFSAFCWSDSVLMYPKPFENLEMTSQVSNTLYQSLTQTLNLAKIPAISDIDIVLGKFTGPMGATHIIVLLVCAVVLMFRRSISALTFCSGLGTMMLFAWIFPKYGDSVLSSLGYELASGMMVFGLLFLACDYNTAPKTRTSRFLYGIIIALMSILFRSVGKVENTIVFAVLVANPLSIPLDKSTLSFSEITGNFLQGCKNKIAEFRSKKASAPAMKITWTDEKTILPRKATKRRKTNGKKRK